MQFQRMILVNAGPNTGHLPEKAEITRNDKNFKYKRLLFGGLGKYS